MNWFLLNLGRVKSIFLLKGLLLLVESLLLRLLLMLIESLMRRLLLMLIESLLLRLLLMLAEILLLLQLRILDSPFILRTFHNCRTHHTVGRFSLIIVS